MIYTWSTLPSIAVIDPFDPELDVLEIDDPHLSAADLEITFGASAPFSVTFESAGRQVTLAVDPAALAGTTITFTDGSLLIVGDGTTGTTADDNRDNVTGGAGDDRIYGLGGNDTLDGHGGSDVLYGGAGDDYLSNGAARSGDVTWLDGGDGSDVLEVPFSAAGIHVLNGGPGGDALLGSTRIGVRGIADYSSNTASQPVIANLGPVSDSSVLVPANAANDGLGSIDLLDAVQTVLGGAGNDRFAGGGVTRNAQGDFQQVFVGGAGDDVIDGLGQASLPNPSGDGWAPRADYSSSTADVIVNLTGYGLDFIDMVVGAHEAYDGIGGANGGHGGRDVLANVMEVYGGRGNDYLVGDTYGQSFNGGAGHDTIGGFYGGHVEARYETAVEYVVVNLTPDRITALDGRTIEAFSAYDGQGTFDHFYNIEDIRGSAFDDFIYGAGGVDERFTGGRGNDTIDGGAGNLDLDYARYTDVPYALGGVSVFLENGSGTANDGYGTTDTLTNIEGAIGTQRNDTLTGGAGDQHFFGRGGNDTLNGGAGSDWAHYSTDPSGVTVNLTAGTAIDGWNGGPAPWSFGFGGTDRLVSIENVEGSLFTDTIAGSSAANTILGRGGNDTLEGRAGNDLLDGGDGNDVLEGGQGADQIAGGAGFDYAKYRYADSYVAVFLAGGEGSGDAHGDTYASIEGVIGSAFNDVLVGNENANDLAGLNGDDTLDGAAGDDNLQGAAGDDFLLGSAGRDHLDGGAGTDWASYMNASAGVVAGFASPWQNTADAAGDGYVSVENLAGSDFADTLVGDGGANILSALLGDDTLEGRAGNDMLLGGGGNDRLEGGAGADALNGDTGFDYAKYRYAAAGVSADLAGLVANTGDAAGETYSGIEGLIGSAFADGLYGEDTANDIAGLDGNDFLVGRGGDDNLQGGNGDDTLDGGANDPGGPMNDRMEGGAGNDRFQFHHGEANGDVVVDFKGIVAGGGDILQFFGYGEAPAFNYVDSTHYIITPDPTVGGPSETITFSNAPLIVDLVDVQYFA